MKFMFSGALLRFAEFSKEIEIAEPTLGRALTSLLDARPQLRPVLLDGVQNVRRSHQMFLNGESMDRNYYTDQHARDRLALDPADSVFFLTAIAGG
jgi:hypothetical protein